MPSCSDKKVASYDVSSSESVKLSHSSILSRPKSNIITDKLNNLVEDQGCKKCNGSGGKDTYPNGEHMNSIWEKCKFCEGSGLKDFT